MIVSYKTYFVIVIRTPCKQFKYLKATIYLMPKIPKTITIDEELLDWIEQKIKDKEFASHAKIISTLCRFKTYHQ
jgi:hypothetical protein